MLEPLLVLRLGGLGAVWLGGEAAGIAGFCSSATALELPVSLRRLFIDIGLLLRAVFTPAEAEESMLVEGV